MDTIIDIATTTENGAVNVLHRTKAIKLDCLRSWQAIWMIWQANMADHPCHVPVINVVNLIYWLRE